MKKQIPILAKVVDEIAFDNLELERKEENKKSVLKSYVKEIKIV